MDALKERLYRRQCDALAAGDLELYELVNYSAIE